MFYFGAWGQAGHYLWDVNHRTVRDRDLPFDFPLTPKFLDTGLLPIRCPQTQKNCHIWRTKGWAIVAFWDRTEDSRQNSNSAFITRTESDPTDSELVEVFAHAFPELAKRIEKLWLPNGSMVALN